MTHTEESLMALAYRTHSEGYGPLCKAIREVLAERDHANQAWDAAIEHANHMTGELERAEAECERLRKEIANLDYRAAYEALEQENVRLRKDAERLRKLLLTCPWPALKDQP